jgi:hypothetical protein
MHRLNTPGQLTHWIRQPLYIYNYKKEKKKQNKCANKPLEARQRDFDFKGNKVIFLCYDK